MREHMDSQKETDDAHDHSRILVVDDDASVRQMLTRLLSGEGYSVWAAANGTAAIEIATAADIELVLLDLKMPGKSGWETFQRLMAKMPSIAVIVITAQPNQLFTALGSGVGALLEKPLDFPLLLRTVNDLLTESPESKRARSAGKSADFHYIHGRKNDSPSKKND